jgi:predicted aspartyl protease
LREQLHGLAKTNEIRIAGLEWVSGDAVSIRSNEELTNQLVKLLSNYDYALVHGRYRSVVALYIVGPRGELPRKPPEVAVKMHRIDSHYFVDAELHVSSDQSFQLRMVVDPTADDVLLPDSVRGMLRISDSELFDTAVVVDDEIVSARQTTVDAISVGKIVVRDVDVTFVPDGDFTKSRVLGRNFLEQLHLEVDGINGRLLLVEP